MLHNKTQVDLPYLKALLMDPKRGTYGQELLELEFLSTSQRTTDSTITNSFLPTPTPALNQEDESQFQGVPPVEGEYDVMLSYQCVLYLLLTFIMNLSIRASIDGAPKPSFQSYGKRLRNLPCSRKGPCVFGWISVGTGIEHV